MRQDSARAWQDQCVFEDVIPGTSGLNKTSREMSEELALDYDEKEVENGELVEREPDGGCWNWGQQLNGTG
ncbi:hypothetical protein NDU88_004604 [Pleurodeles waltl]|uniref:Uncharacterized protein n=1 Tax=Pleurodeles waltl TaxID=8319 RepID=A0AAV7L0D4_PLEWA|nr:hypothetical protein NDU88_004604 [Pleurodeles waltl]